MFNYTAKSRAGLRGGRHAGYRYIIIVLLSFCSITAVQAEQSNSCKQCRDQQQVRGLHADTRLADRGTDLKAAYAVLGFGVSEAKP